jgi:GMP synthase (glutamine-hydrolysing)
MLDAGGWREPAPATGFGKDLREDRSARLSILVVVHQVHSNPGHVGHWFRRNEYALDIRRPYEGQSLPETLREHAGAVIFARIPQVVRDLCHPPAAQITYISVH